MALRVSTDLERNAARDGQARFGYPFHDFHYIWRAITTTLALMTLWDLFCIWGKACSWKNSTLQERGIILMILI